ncbi:hypothetical protein ACTFIU_006933 [Dictyostelium citrinum]
MKIYHKINGWKKRLNLKQEKDEDKEDEKSSEAPKQDPKYDLDRYMDSASFKGLHIIDLKDSSSSSVNTVSGGASGGISSDDEKLDKDEETDQALPAATDSQLRDIPQIKSTIGPLSPKADSEDDKLDCLNQKEQFTKEQLENLTYLDKEKVVFDDGDQDMEPDGDEECEESVEDKN